MDLNHQPFDLDGLGTGRFATERCIPAEELLECLRIPAGHCADRIRCTEALFTFPEVLPKMAQMIERVRAD